MLATTDAMLGFIPRGHYGSFGLYGSGVYAAVALAEEVRIHHFEVRLDNRYTILEINSFHKSGPKGKNGLKVPSRPLLSREVNENHRCNLANILVHAFDQELTIFGSSHFYIYKLKPLDLPKRVKNEV